MMKGGTDLSNLDDKERISSQETTTKTDNGQTHPAVLVVFGTDHILEEICSYLELNDLKQFRLVSTTCSNEGRRAIIGRDKHWVVVKSNDNNWQLVLEHVLRNLEELTFASNENLPGWVFKRLELEDWKHCLLGRPNYFLREWGYYLQKVHLKADAYTAFRSCRLMHTIHELLSVSCLNLKEMTVFQKYLSNVEIDLSSRRGLKNCEFSWPSLKLQCLVVKYKWASYFPQEVGNVLQTFYTRLILAAGSELEELEIDYGGGTEEDLLEGGMLNAISLNKKEESNFQSLKKITLKSPVHVGNLSRTVQKSFPRLTEIMLRSFFTWSVIDEASYVVFPEAFPALRCLTIEFIRYDHINTGGICYFLQHLPTLEVLTISSHKPRLPNHWPVMPPLVPYCYCLRSFTFKSKRHDLQMLQCVLIIFPNLVELNLLKFGRNGRDAIKEEPEYSFGELIDTISPLLGLKQLYVNHAFHTFPQLSDALEVTTNLSALERLILLQTAHDNDPEHDFKVSLYLTSSDPEFQYILDCDSVKGLESVQLFNFRFGTTRKEAEEEAANKGGHVQFGTMCP